MTAMDFPNAPTNGQIFTSGNSTWTYNGVYWSGVGSTTITISDTAPSSPTSGNLWWDSVAGQLYIYFNDGNSSQWVPATNFGNIPTPIAIASGGTGAITAGAALTNLGGASTSYVDAKTWGYAALPAAVQIVPVSFPITGKPLASAVLNVPMPWAITIPASLASAVIYQGTVTTSNAVFTVNKISGGTTTALGTITVTSAGRTTCTLAGAGGSLAIGDVIQLVAPSTQDATLADIGITLVANRT